MIGGPEMLENPFIVAKSLCIYRIYEHGRKLKRIHLFYVYEFDFQSSSFCEVGKCKSIKFLYNFPKKDNMYWSKCIGLCTNNAKAMTEYRFGITPNTAWLHSFLHQEALSSKCLPLELDCVMRLVIKILNTIREKALQSHIKTKVKI